MNRSVSKKSLFFPQARYTRHMKADTTLESIMREEEEEP